MKLTWCYAIYTKSFFQNHFWSICSILSMYFGRSAAYYLCILVYLKHTIYVFSRSAAYYLCIWSICSILSMDLVDLQHIIYVFWSLCSILSMYLVDLKHTIYVFIFQFWYFHLFIDLEICSINLIIDLIRISIVSNYPFIYPSIFLSIYISIYLPIYPAILIFIYPSNCLSIYLSNYIYLSIYSSICLSIYMSIYLFRWLDCFLEKKWL